jgi:SP family general alpha glucoside:H+ symporter-like MFS transporter
MADLEPKGHSPTNVSQDHDVIQEKGGLAAEDHHIELLKNQDAYDAENREHEQTTWQALKSHPWAAFWAFLMCFTIVG